jgi:hypothetical protein
MQKGLTTILILGSILAIDANHPARAALTQPMAPQQQSQTTPAGWAYYPDYPYYYAPVVPEYYYYEPVVPIVPAVPYYYAPEPYYIQPGLSFNISL